MRKSQRRQLVAILQNMNSALESLTDAQNKTNQTISALQRRVYDLEDKLKRYENA